MALAKVENRKNEENNSCFASHYQTVFDLVWKGIEFKNGTVGVFFASRKLMYSLAIFACPTLERYLPSFHLIRDEPIVLEYH